MARKQTKSATIFKEWEDVNQALRRLGEIEILRQELEGQMTLEINEIRDRYNAQFDGLKKEAKELEENIRGFAEERKAEFLKKRTRTLDFGTVAYRMTKRIVIRNTKAVVAAIKALGWTQYLKIKESPDKEALDGLSDQELARIGVTRKIEDKLRIEPNIERLKEAA